MIQLKILKINWSVYWIFLSETKLELSNELKSVSTRLSSSQLIVKLRLIESIIASNYNLNINILLCNVIFGWDQQKEFFSNIHVGIKS